MASLERSSRERRPSLRLVLVLLGATLTAPACAQILGAKELPEGTGGTTTTTTTTTGSSSGTTASSTASSSSSSGPGICVTETTCTYCAGCMEMDGGPCNLADAGCPKGSECGNYVACTVQCPMDGGYAACAMSCLSMPPTGFDTVKECLCTQCHSVCDPFCQ